MAVSETGPRPIVRSTWASRTTASADAQTSDARGRRGTVRLLLPTTVSLGTVDDVEGFVCHTLGRSGINFGEDEREDLILEGIAIMYELFAAFKPRLDGYEQDGTFDGYAARYLPRRLTDAWHKAHPEHRRVITEDGSRKWVYLDTEVSLDGANAEDPDRIDGLALAPAKWTAPVAA